MHPLTSSPSFRQEALRQAERERRKKYKAQDDEREVVRAAMREKVSSSAREFVLFLFSCAQYNIEAPVNEEDIEDEDEDEDGFGGGKKKEDEDEEDPVERKQKD